MTDDLKYFTKLGRQNSIHVTVSPPNLPRFSLIMYSKLDSQTHAYSLPCYSMVSLILQCLLRGAKRNGSAIWSEFLEL
jgi:hypothetical protein